VRVLATSREPLGVPAEKLFPISTLTCPPEHATLDETRSTDAVKLFLHRLHRHAADFPEDATTLPVIAEICRRLDGIPLAIELAAARAVTLGLDTVRSHLDNRFALLTGGSHDVLPRHQTLKAVFEWSYRLLSDTEQLLFREAGIFVDGFSLDAALSMMARHELSASATVEGLAGLVSKSLLSVDRKNPRRYRQLESARVYARTLLDTHGEIANASHAHAMFYRDFFEAYQRGSEQSHVGDTHAMCSAEIGNLRAALTWAFGTSGSEYLGIELTAIAAPTLFDLPRLEECAHWASIALKALTEFKLDRRLPHTRLKLLSAYASALVYTEGPKDCVDQAWKETMEAAKTCDDAGQQLRAAWGLWNRWQYAGDAARAHACARDFVNAAGQIGTPQHRVLGQRLMGIALHYRGRHEEARVELQAVLDAPDLAIERWSSTGAGIDQVALTKATLARTLWFLGDTQASIALVEDAEESARAARQELSLAYVLMEASIPLATLQMMPDALRLAIDGLRKVCRTANIPVWLVCCDVFEWIACAQGTTLEQSELEQMEMAIARLRNTGYLAPYPLVLAEFARALDASGQQTRALAILADAIKHCSARESAWYDSQLTSIQESVERKGPARAV
jgi:predicted ATPase